MHLSPEEFSSGPYWVGDPYPRDTAGARLFHAEGWTGWEQLPPRLREDWRRVAAGEPLTGYGSDYPTAS